MARELVDGRARAQLDHAVRPSGNFEIFRAASRHLLTGQDLYAEYPAEHSDRFKYSPTFALLFAPLAWIPWPVALFLWSALNALLLFVAVERVLPGRPAMLAMGLLLLEVLRGMQNAQSNALVAALIVLAFAAMERHRGWRAALAVALGACVKIFPLAALTFAIPRRRAMRTGLAAGVVGFALVVLPLALLSPTALAAQYGSWRGVEASDAQQRWFSVMELVHRITGVALPNWPLQLPRHRRAARAARDPARAMGRSALPAAVPVLRAAVRGAVQSPGGARELSDRVRRSHDLVRVRGANAERAPRSTPSPR